MHGKEKHFLWHYQKLIGICNDFISNPSNVHINYYRESCHKIGTAFNVTFIFVYSSLIDNDCIASYDGYFISQWNKHLELLTSLVEIDLHGLSEKWIQSSLIPWGSIIYCLGKTLSLTR